MSFECHITLSAKDASRATEYAHLWKWKTSEIARDPLLGEDTFFYLTAHDGQYQPIYEKMIMAKNHLEDRGIKVLRMKIEQIVYDTKRSLYKQVTELRKDDYEI